MPNKNKDLQFVSEEIVEKVKTELEENSDFTLSRDEFTSILAEDTELTEDDKEKIFTIFETAVNSRVSTIKESLLEAVDSMISEQVEEFVSKSEENISTYIDHVVESFIEENRLAIENGITQEKASGLLEDFAELVSKYSLDINEDNVDVVSELNNKVEDLKDKLNEALAENLAQKEVVFEIQRDDTFREMTEGYSDVEIEKLRKLSENIDASDIETYTSKLEVVIENFSVTSTSSNGKKNSDKIEESVEIDKETSTNPYTDYLNRQVRKVS